MRYIHSRWKQTPHSNVWPSGKDTYYIYGICNENKHLTHTPSSNVRYVTRLGVQPTRTSNVQTFPHSSFESSFKARLKRQNTYPKLSKRGMKWFLHYFFTELAVLPHRVSVLLYCKRERGLDSGFRRCPVLSLPLPAFSVSPFAKRLLIAVRSAFARPHRTASPPPPQATKHIINKITKNNYEKNNLTTFLSIPMPDDCRVLVG